MPNSGSLQLDHHGFTLGAVTGRLVADVGATGTRFIDAQPFRPGRF